MTIANMKNDVVKQEYESGMSLIDLGKKYNCTPTAVRYRLLSQGVTMRPRGRYEKRVELAIPTEEVITRYESGESGNKIAEDADCAPSTLYRFLRWHGVEVSDRRGRGSSGRSLYDKEQLAKMYEELGSFRKVGKELGISRQRVHQLLKDYKSPAMVNGRVNAGV